MTKRTRKTKKSRKQKKGGTLIIEETYLRNTHLCPKISKPGKIVSKKDTVGQELFTYNGEIFQLNMNTLGYLQQQYKKMDDKWFKFVIFNNDETKYIYLINGGQINKHSVCMLIGLLEVTKMSNEYEELRYAVNILQLFKINNDPLVIEDDENLKRERNILIDRVDYLISEKIRCMPVIAAGSGTVNDDDSICINDKSGHYKPTLETMTIAKEIFEEITNSTVIITEKADKELLKAKYGELYENYTGICL
jgi:hypothetical protein